MKKRMCRLNKLLCLGLSALVMFASVLMSGGEAWAASGSYSAETLAEAAGQALSERIAEKGLDAFENSALFQKFEGNDQQFDGTKVIPIADETTIANVSRVNTGSIIFRFKVAGGNSANAVLLGAKGASGAANLSFQNNCSSFFMNPAGNVKNFRFVMNHTQASWPVDFEDNEWHCVVLSSNDSKALRLTIDGTEVWNNTSPENKGLLGTMAAMEQLTIGGHLDGETKEYPFKGEISHIIVTDEALSDEDAIKVSKMGYSGSHLGTQIGAMFNTAVDNSWVFVGGSAVAGGFDQVRGARNYIGEFEEYIRWKHGNTEYGKQRYTINSGKNGRTLADIVANWDTAVAAYQPKAAAYFVGSEDYAAGADAAKITEFKENLKSFIDHALALKANTGFAVIQKPYATTDPAKNAVIEAYCGAVDAVAETYESQEAGQRIVVVDHYGQTKDAAGWSDKLNADGTLNKNGHLEIGRQLCLATIKTADRYPQDVFSNLDLVEEAQCETYMDISPAITASDNGLQVSIPQDAGNAWKYELTIGGMRIEASVEGNTFTISDLPRDASYVLKIKSADGKKQLRTMKGTVLEGSKAVLNNQVLTENQQRIAAKVADETTPLTWLFVGDSITHACHWTLGYDGTAQTMNKYVRGVLGREDDTIINTGGSGATTVTTLNNIEYRVKQYKADIVTIMLGTNDAGALSTDDYRAKLKEIIAAVKAANGDASIILRTPTPTVGTNTTKRAQIEANIEAMRSVAQEDASLIFVDQYTEVESLKNTYSWFASPQTKIYGNNDWLHPGANGQLIMTRQVLRGMGLWNEDNAISNLFYDMQIAEDAVDVTPQLQVTAESISVSLAELEAQSGKQIGSVTLTATDVDGKSYTMTADQTANVAQISNLPGNKTYQVAVSAYLRNEAKKVTFNAQSKTLGSVDSTD